jgi:class 3 adenylate cyclase
MHRTLKELLPTAKGESHLVVVVFLDIRGFSSFAKIAESSEAALFLRSAYVRILDEYFPNASFFKPTGDGLLVILDYDETNLAAIVNDAVDSSIRLVEDFGSLTSSDPMINFDVPDSLGIGLARGAATALVSRDQVLDYSGRPLNLASRLMDLARPRGVVIDRSLGWNLVEDKHTAQFSEEAVYVKGIAEETPMKVYVLRKLVVLPLASKRPIRKFVWKTTPKEELTFKQLQERSIYLVPLPVEPAITDDIRVHVDYPMITAGGRISRSMVSTQSFKATYVYQQGAHWASVDFLEISEELKEENAKDAWAIKIEVEYALHAEV